MNTTVETFVDALPSRGAWNGRARTNRRAEAHHRRRARRFARPGPTLGERPERPTAPARIHRLQSMIQAVATIADDLRAAGVRALRVIGPQAAGAAPAGCITLACHGDRTDRDDPALLTVLTTALHAAVILIPMNSPDIGVRPSFELL